MSEGLDRREGSEEPTEESLEDIREEFLEKYDEDEGRPEPSQEGKAEGESTSDRDGHEVSNPDREREQNDEEQTLNHSEVTESSAFEAETTEPANSTPEEAEPAAGEAEDPALSLEEYREETLEKYEQEDALGSEVAEGGESEDAGGSQQEELDAPREEVGRVEPDESGEVIGEPVYPEDVIHTAESSDLDSFEVGHEDESDAGPMSSVDDEESSSVRLGTSQQPEADSSSIGDQELESPDQAPELEAPSADSHNPNPGEAADITEQEASPAESVQMDSPEELASTRFEPEPAESFDCGSQIVVEMDSAGADDQANFQKAGLERPAGEETDDVTNPGVPIEAHSAEESGNLIPDETNQGEQERLFVVQPSNEVSVTDVENSSDGQPGSNETTLPTTEVAYVPTPDVPAETANSQRSETVEVLDVPSPHPIREELSPSTDQTAGSPEMQSRLESVATAPASSDEAQMQTVLEARSFENPTGEDFGPRTPSELESAEPRNPELPELKASDTEVTELESRAAPEEPRTFEVIDHQRGPMLRIPKSDLERAGAGTDEMKDREIVELVVRDASEEGERIRTVFGRYDADNRRVEAYLGKGGDYEGHELQLVMAGGYSEGRMVQDFNERKCEHLGNVKLELGDGEMVLAVDGRKIPFDDRRLSTNGSEAVLKGKIGDESDFKVSFDGNRTTARFGRGYPVDGMKMEGDELVVSYSQSRNERHEHRMYLEHLETPERPSLSQFDRPEMREHVKMFDHPERVEGEYQFVLDQEARDEIRTLLDGALRKGDKQYDLMKAEVSERLVPNLLELAGWERIKRHPFNDTKKEGASANGTDWLIRTPDEKEAIMEVKWWGDTVRAESKGVLQVTKDFETKSKDEGPRITDAYVAIVDWEVNDEPTKVYVKRVRPEVIMK